jgi:hypothetical protein
MLQRIGHSLHLGWRIVTELHTALWVVLGIFAILPASAAAVLASFWGEHSAGLLILIFVIALCAFALLGLSTLGYVEEAREIQEAIRIELGEGMPFDKFKESLHTQNHLISVGVAARKTVTNCKLTLENITGPFTTRCPITIRSNFTINAGDTEYIPFAEFTERLDRSRPAPSKPGLIRVDFPVNPLSDGKSYLDAGWYDLALLATAAETAPTRMKCRLAVNDGFLSLRPI